MLREIGQVVGEDRDAEADEYERSDQGDQAPGAPDPQDLETPGAHRASAPASTGATVSERMTSSRLGRTGEIDTNREPQAASNPARWASTSPGSAAENSSSPGPNSSTEDTHEAAPTAGGRPPATGTSPRRRGDRRAAPDREACRWRGSRRGRRSPPPRRGRGWRGPRSWLARARPRGGGPARAQPDRAQRPARRRGAPPARRRGQRRY